MGRRKNEPEKLPYEVIKAVKKDDQKFVNKAQRLAILKTSKPPCEGARRPFKRELLTSESEDDDCVELELVEKKPKVVPKSKASLASTEPTTSSASKKVKKTENDTIQAYIEQFQDEFDHKLNNQYRDLSRQQRELYDKYMQLKKVCENLKK